MYTYNNVTEKLVKRNLYRKIKTLILCSITLFFVKPYRSWDSEEADCRSFCKRFPYQNDDFLASHADQILWLFSILNFSLLTITDHYKKQGRIEFLLCPVFKGIVLSIYSLVDIRFFYQMGCVNTVNWECVYVAFLVSTGSLSKSHLNYIVILLWLCLFKVIQCTNSILGKVWKGEFLR